MRPAPPSRTVRHTTLEGLARWPPQYPGAGGLLSDFA